MQDMVVSKYGTPKKYGAKPDISTAPMAPGRHNKGQPSMAAPEATKTARGVSSRTAPGVSLKPLEKCHHFQTSHDSVCITFAALDDCQKQKMLFEM